MTIANLNVFSHKNQVPDMGKLDVFDGCHYLQSLDWYRCHPESLLATSMTDDELTARSVVSLEEVSVQAWYNWIYL